MKTIHYNPSPIEVAFAQGIAELKDEIQQKVADYTITQVTNNVQRDNPHLVFTLTDADGDTHELMLQFIQRIDD